MPDGLCRAPVPRRGAGELRSGRCEGEKGSVVSGYPSLGSLMSGLCGHVLPGPFQVSEEPRAAPILASTRSGFPLLKTRLWLGLFFFFLSQTPGILRAALAQAPVSACCVLHQLLFPPAWPGSCLVCTGPRVSALLAAVPGCSPQPSLSARISGCLEESCA